MTNESTLIALDYACKASVAVHANAAGPTQYRAFYDRPLHKVNGVIQTHGWNGDPLPTDPLPLDNAMLGLIAIWDDMVPANLSTAALRKDDYWAARPVIDDVVLPDFPDKPMAIYRFCNVAGQLLYVGQTGDFIGRVMQHRDWNGKGTENQAWKLEIDHSKTTLEVAWGRQNALAREKHLIRTERPLHNVQHAVR